MIDRAKMLERHLPERYVAGQLSPEETAEFEEFLLENPDIIDQVEIARQTRLGLRTLSEQGKLDALVSRKPEPARRWLIAAGVAGLALLGGLAVWLQGTSAPVLSASLEEFGSRAHPVAAEFLLTRTRGASGQKITLPPDPATLLFRLEVPSDPVAAQYRVELHHDGKTLSEVQKIAPGADGVLSIYLRTDGLEPGEYRLTASKGDDPPTGEYPLRFEAGK